MIVVEREVISLGNKAFKCCALLVITGIKRLKTLTFVSGFVPAAILFMTGM